MATIKSIRQTMNAKTRSYLAALFRAVNKPAPTANAFNTSIAAPATSLKRDIRFSLSGKPINIVKLIKNNTLTLAEIFKRIPKDRKANAARDSVTLVKFKQSLKSTERFVAMTETYERKGSKHSKFITRKHKQSIVRLEPERPLYKSKVKLTCTCVVGDTWVNTVDGLRQVKDIAVNKRHGIADQTYILNGKKTKGTKFWKTGTKPVFKLVTDKGYELTATDNHRILVQKEYTAKPLLIDGVYVGSHTHAIDEWRELKDIQPGDKVVLNHSTHANQNGYGRINRKKELEGYLLGLLVGDGTFFADGHPDMVLYSDKGTVYQVIKSLPYVKGKTFIEHEGTDRLTGYRVKFDRATVKPFLEKYDVVRGNKTLTPQIMQEPSVLVGFIAGLFDTDGSIAKQGNSLGIYNTNDDLLKNVQIALAFYGIISTLHSVRKKGKVVVANNVKESKTKELYKLDITGSNADRFFNLFTIRHPNKLPTKDHVRNDQIKRYATVESITPAGKQDVYDVTIDKEHRFSANGIVVHNCEDFMFVWEYALWRRGNSEIIYSNGEPPMAKNPRYVPGACKHQYILMQHILRNRISKIAK